MSDMLKDATARPWAATKDKPRKITRTGVLICNAVLRNSATTKQNAKGKGELEATANARLIVTAVNSYEPMLAALEALNSHIETMQSQMVQYLEPKGYTSFDRKTIAFEKDKPAQSEMFINDMIWLLDGPEQRKAQKLARAAIALAKGETS